MKIIIIGAGIAGLTLGLACQNAGIDFVIYEKASELKNIGGGILLWAHGLRYLRWLGLDKLLDPYWVDVTECNVISNEGRSIFTETLEPLNHLIGGATLPIDRSVLQQALAKPISPNKLKFGKRCESIIGNTVYFNDGSSDQADIIVGADGINSSVRKFIDDTKPTFTGYCWWGGIVEQKNVPNLSAEQVYFSVGLNKACITWPTANNHFMWYIPIKMGMDDFLASSNKQQQLQNLCVDWHEDVTQIISAPIIGKGFHLPIYDSAGQTALTKNNIVLVGDAAHALGPILGQGASMAIEDVYVLMKCLETKSSSLETKLANYEMFRTNRKQKIHELERLSAASMISESHDMLASFEEQLKNISLVSMYEELIPLVNESASFSLDESLTRLSAA